MYEFLVSSNIDRCRDDAKIITPFSFIDPISHSTPDQTILNRILVEDL